MKPNMAPKKYNKANEILETFRLLGIGAKSFKINFDKLPVQYREQDRYQEITQLNHQCKESSDPYKKQTYYKSLKG